MSIIKTIRIIIVDDHAMVREGLRSLLQRLPGVEVIAEAADGRTATKLAAELLPDVVLMDIAMPDLNGIDATRQLMASGDGAKVIALSGRANARFAKEMLKVGASGFVLKESAFKELAEALRTVMADRVYFSPSIAKAVMAEMRSGEDGPSLALSVREREVLQLMSEGKATKEIARRLSLSGKTIETHRRNLMEKLKLYSVAELTKYAIREGVTTAEI